MVREIAVYVYLRLFSFLFTIFKLLPLQTKIVFVASFTENNISIYKEMKRQDVPWRSVFLVDKKAYPHFSKYKDIKVLLFDIKHVAQFIISIYHLATAKIVFVDNYFGFLAATKFKKDVKCIQLWHANGAIKKFGLKDHSVKDRSAQAKERFNQVYNKFDKVVVGSEAMADIFKQAFGLNEDQLLRTGLPRTDLFFDEGKKEYILHNLYSKYPFLAAKKVILYAPTFRDEQLDEFELRINLDMLKKELGSEYILLLKLHPAIRGALEITENQNGFVYDFSDYQNINELFFVTDLLITDYSSLPFEFSLLNKPMLFFPYDLTEYQRTRGLWENYEELVPGPVTFTTAEIITSIKNHYFQFEEIEAFNKKWNTYSEGKSSRDIVAFAKRHLLEEVKEHIPAKTDLYQ
ncbi:CDP-glycerol glycerophosphotransferase family protein [Mesobacillus foraminis]|uniref:CDP-glycerol glycerophosphotransferase family protein n=1 Tax=Mesobacillus foraminis TaxID=279826 RepID=UPI000EF49364|nr:CDP-glycerol glycerophosphotransferase family protein [Mesobacillus foraminis]